MSVLEYSYQPSLNIDEVNRQVSALVDACKTALLDCASSQAVEEVSLKAEQNGEQAARRVAEISARVNETSSKVNLLATYDTAQGTISVSAALVNGIAQSNILLSGDHIILDGDVTIRSGQNGFYLSGGNIVSNSITSTQIASATITANEIAGNTITAAEIASGTITANEIAAHTITAAEISSNYVYAGSISANQITSGSISADRIRSGSITSYDSDYISIKNPSETIVVPLFAGTVIDTDMGASFDGLCTGNLGCNKLDATAVYVSGRMTSKYATLTSISSGSGDDLIIRSSGTIGTKSGSSKRFKNSISRELTEEMDPHRLYNLPIVKFKYNTDYLGDKDDQCYDRPLIGFIAEEMNDIYPQACRYDGEKRPSGWDPYYIIPPMLALIQEHNERLKRLEEKLDA